MCHGDVVTRMAGIMSHAVLCNNGLGQLMETGEYYESPREDRPRCVFKVIKQSYDMTIRLAVRIQK